MTDELFVKIIGAIITIVVSLVSAYVVPYIKAKIGTEGMNKLYWYVDLAVRCADQIYTKDEWAKKKEYVLDYIVDVANNKLHLNLSIEDIDLIIEGAVNSIHDNGVKE